MLLVFSDKFIVLILGKKYLQSGAVLKVFSAVIVFMFLSKLAERMLIVGKRQLIVTSIAAVALVINVVFDFVLIPKMGIVGAALATFLAEVTLFGLGLYYTYKYVSDAAVYLCVLKVILVFTVTCTVVTLTALYTSKLMSMVCGPAFYLLGVMFLGLIPMAEVHEIKDRIMAGLRLRLKQSKTGSP
jgi:O-antigen/teichoic acid export membrane protein